MGLGHYPRRRLNSALALKLKNALPTDACLPAQAQHHRCAQQRLQLTCRVWWLLETRMKVQLLVIPVFLCSPAARHVMLEGRAGAAGGRLPGMAV